MAFKTWWGQALCGRYNLLPPPDSNRVNVSAITWYVPISTGAPAVRSRRALEWSTGNLRGKNSEPKLHPWGGFFGP